MNSDTLMPFATITIGEIVDVLLVAILVYTAIVWLRRTRAAFVVRGILILGAAYMLVRYLDLQMTAWIFQAFFAVFVVMIVVIFQEELRQMFERIAVWSFTRQPVPTATSASVFAAIAPRPYNTSAACSHPNTGCTRGPSARYAPIGNPRSTRMKMSVTASARATFLAAATARSIMSG